MNTPTQISEVNDGCLTSLIQTNYQLKQLKTDQHTYLNKNTLIIGKRATGKTSFIICEIYRLIENDIDQIYVITPEEYSFQSEYKKITNKTYLLRDMPDILSHIKDNHDQRCLIVMDDVSELEKSSAFKEIIINGRNLHVTVAISLQYPMFSPGIRGNIDNIVVAHDNNLSTVKRLYEQYFGIYPSFTIFKEIIQTLPKYKFLFIINTSITHNYDDVIGYHMADTKCGNLVYRANDFVVPKDKSVDMSTLLQRVNNVINELIDIRNQLKSDPIIPQIQLRPWTQST